MQPYALAQGCRRQILVSSEAAFGNRTESAAALLQVKEIVQWKNPALSALVLLLGSFCALAGEFILRGDHKVTPLKGARPLLHMNIVRLSLMLTLPISGYAERCMSAVVVYQTFTIMQRFSDRA